jgi:hypothetical protein
VFTMPIRVFTIPIPVFTIRRSSRSRSSDPRVHRGPKPAPPPNSRRKLNEMEARLIGMSGTHRLQERAGTGLQLDWPSPSSEGVRQQPSHALGRSKHMQSGTYVEHDAIDMAAMH